MLAYLRQIFDWLVVLIEILGDEAKTHFEKKDDFKDKLDGVVVLDVLDCWVMHPDHSEVLFHREFHVAVEVNILSKCSKDGIYDWWTDTNHKYKYFPYMKENVFRRNDDPSHEFINERLFMIKFWYFILIIITGFCLNIVFFDFLFFILVH